MKLRAYIEHRDCNPSVEEWPCAYVNETDASRFVEAMSKQPAFKSGRLEQLCNVHGWEPRTECNARGCQQIVCEETPDRDGYCETCREEADESFPAHSACNGNGCEACSGFPA